VTDTQTPAPVLIVGATSDISIALAHKLAAKGHALYLAARNKNRLDADCADLKLRHNVEVTSLEMDVTDTTAIRGALRALEPAPHTIVSMVGYMGDQAEQEADVTEVAKVIAANFEGPAALGRARNYYYGASKAGFTAMMSGLRQRLSKSKTTVITVKPGFVATKMTEGMDLPGPLVDSAEKSAAMIERAIRKKREVVYPWKWRLVMMVIRGLPEPIFKAVKI